MLFFSFIYVTEIPEFYHRTGIVEQVDDSSREAMLWIRGHTDPRASFVVVSGAEAWFFDRIAEWFPVLAGRSSLTTAQGLEWAGPGVFDAKTIEISKLKFAQAGAPELIASFVRQRYCAADYVAVFTARDAAERQSFLASASFQPLFANEQAAVFRQRRNGENCTLAAPPEGELGGSPADAEAS